MTDLKSVSDFASINLDLGSLAEFISDYKFPGISSNQDPCFYHNEDGFENCIYNKDDKLLWGYTVFLSKEETNGEFPNKNQLNIRIAFFDSHFEVISEKEISIPLNMKIKLVQKSIFDILVQFSKEKQYSIKKST